MTPSRLSCKVRVKGPAIDVAVDSRKKIRINEAARTVHVQQLKQETKISQRPPLCRVVLHCYAVSCNTRQVHSSAIKKVYRKTRQESPILAAKARKSWINTSG